MRLEDTLKKFPHGSHVATVQGTAAVHQIYVAASTMSEADWERHRAILTSWKTDSGNHFKTSGAARGWLVRFLKKPGWPESTVWVIWSHGVDAWGVYQINEPQS